MTRNAPLVPGIFSVVQIFVWDENQKSMYFLGKEKEKEKAKSQQNFIKSSTLVLHYFPKRVLYYV